LRRAAGPLLVAGNRVRDLLLRAKHLFVAATFGRRWTWQRRATTNGQLRWPMKPAGLVR